MNWNKKQILRKKANLSFFNEEELENKFKNYILLLNYKKVILI